MIGESEGDRFVAAVEEFRGSTKGSFAASMSTYMDGMIECGGKMNDASNPSKPDSRSRFPARWCRASATSPPLCACRCFGTRPTSRSAWSACVDGGTTNRPGAAHGPRQMRDLSTMMRRVHHVHRRGALRARKCGDLGDAPVNPGEPRDSMERIEIFFAKLHAAGAVPLSAGGDHLITLPIMRGIRKGLPPLGMVHSTPTATPGTPISAATNTPMARRSAAPSRRGFWTPGASSRSASAARSNKRDDNQWAVDQGMRVHHRGVFRPRPSQGDRRGAPRGGRGADLCQLRRRRLDPAYAPGTGTPEIGGYTPHEAQRMLRGLRGLNLVGGDVVEVSPPFDMSGNTALVGVTMMWEILLPCCRVRRQGARAPLTIPAHARARH